MIAITYRGRQPVCPRPPDRREPRGNKRKSTRSRQIAGASAGRLVSNPWWGDPRAAAAASDLGREAIAIALELEPGHALAKCCQGMLYSAARQLEEAASAFRQALAMDEGLASAHGFGGYNAALLGRAWETLPAVERAMRLDRTDRKQSVFFWYGGFAELLLGRTEAAIALLCKSLKRNPSYGGAQLCLMCISAPK